MATLVFQARNKYNATATKTFQVKMSKDRKIKVKLITVFK